MAQPCASTTVATEPRTLPLRALVLLGCLTAAAPLVTDFYLPALPDLARSLGTSDALAQLTISVSLVGLALGQLVAGPLSDRIGRMRPLRYGVLLLVATSFLCAIAGNIAVLLALRLVQGLAGAAAVVVARAIVRDVYDGAQAARIYSELMLVMGLAPVLAPMLGGQLLRFTDWRGIFVVLGVMTASLLVACWLVLDETAPAVGRAARNELSRPRDRGAFAALLADPTFRRFLTMAGLLGVVLFTYITMSSFVLRDEFDLGPVAYSWVFGANALGMVVGSQVNARVVERWGPARMLRLGLGTIALAGSSLTVAVLVGAALGWVLAPLWFVLCGLGMSMGNMTALALAPHAATAGTAAALLGTCQFLFGAAVPPLVSARGGADGLTMGAVMALAGLGALAMGLSVTRPTRRRTRRADE